jgi:hypothetical protein
MPPFFGSVTDREKNKSIEQSSIYPPGRAHQSAALQFRQKAFSVIGQAQRPCPVAAPQCLVDRVRNHELIAVIILNKKEFGPALPTGPEFYPITKHRIHNSPPFFLKIAP